MDLEDSKTDIDSCISLACAIELSTDFSKSFQSAEHLTVAAVKLFSQTTRRQPDQPGTSATHQVANKPRPHCQFCGLKQQPRTAKKDTCHKCSKAGHWASVCRTTAAVLQQSFDDELETAVVLCSTGLPSANLNVSLNFAVSNEPVQAMIDTGSTGSFLSTSQGAKHGLKVGAKREVTALTSGDFQVRSGTARKLR